MTMISPQQEQMNQMVAQQGDLNVGLTEGVQASMAETWDTSPMQAAGRAIRSIFDTSDKIKPEDANQMFGLHGTSAEFKPDEEITLNAAKERAHNFHNDYMNNIIKATVNEDSPIMGNVTQFAASMATSMLDPVLLAANLAGAQLVGAGAKAITQSGRLFNMVAKSPTMGKALLSAYEEGAKRSLMTVVAREGLENFAGSLIEEGIHHVGVGDERLARKYTWQDSMQNIVAGTVMGTMFGTVLSKDGRKAISDGYLFDWGDDAADFVKANTVISGLEAQAGHEKGRLEMDMMNRERFANRPWYNLQEAQFTPNSTSIPKRVWLPLDENGAVHTFSHRGGGTVLTGSQVHAMNSGVKVMEVHTDKLKLADPSAVINTKLGTKIGANLAEEFVNNTSPEKLTRAMAILHDPEVSLGDVVTKSMKELKSDLAGMLKGKNLDEMSDIVHQLKSRSESKFDMHPVLEKTLDGEGYHGYTFNGKDFDGKPAYQGVYVSEKYTSRLRKQSVQDVPMPNAGDKAKWQFEQEQMYRKHKDWVANDAKSLKQVDDIKESMGLPKETPIEDVATAVKQNHVKEAIASTKEKVSALTKVRDELKAQIDSAKAAGKEIDPDMEKNVAFMEDIMAGKDPHKIIEQDTMGAENYIGCILGLATKAVTK